MEVLAHPTGPLPSSGKPATPNEVAYARWADRTPHVVVSKTLDKVTWKNARIVRGIDAVRRLTQQPGRNIYVVGGATLVGSLMNEGLIDELRLTVDPRILGGGKALFKDVTRRVALQLVRTQSTGSGRVRLTYRIRR
jgi:dihydrofolate reductase